MMRTRVPTASDIDRLGQIAEQAGLFPAEMMPDMIAPALASGGDIWLVAEDDGGAIGFAFARSEEMTDSVWNVLAIGVDPSAHGKGYGKQLLAATERALSDARMIIIETTQLSEQQAARAMYEKAGYNRVAHIPDFYSDGEDKIVFCKRAGGIS